MSNRASRLIVAGAVLAAGLLVIAGCSKKTESGGTAMGDAVRTAAAETMFRTNCANCHRMGALGGGRAPDLSHLGAQKSADWIAAHIKNPKSHNGLSKMPAFEGRMPDADIQTLASHIASLK